MSGQLGIEVWIRVKKREVYTYNRLKNGLTLMGAFTSKPDVAKDERAIKLHLTVPASIFTTPEISATIDVPEELILAPEVDIEVQEP